MKHSALIFLGVLLFIGCGNGHNIPPYSYQGPIDGDYAKSKEYTSACLQVKDCMDIEKNYSLPRLRIYVEGDTVQCVGETRRGCYTPGGLIEITEQSKIDTIVHECMHHWLKKDTGNLDPGHRSELWCECDETWRGCEGEL